VSDLRPHILLLAGAVIRTRREQLEITQWELAALAGVHADAISLIERGVTPSDERQWRRCLFRLVVVLGLPVEACFDFARTDWLPLDALQRMARQAMVIGSGRDELFIQALDREISRREQRWRAAPSEDATKQI
jgi:DNA-binding XRE family transcriptional regulator